MESPSDHFYPKQYGGPSNPHMLMARDIPATDGKEVVGIVALGVNPDCHLNFVPLVVEDNGALHKFGAGGWHMRIITACVTIVFLGCFGLSGCVWTPNYKPKTKAGAECKRDCAMAGAGCSASPYSCDKARSLCIRSCIDLEAVDK